jgi:hypothetical protein
MITMSKLISFSEFAGLAGIKSNALSVYVNRQKVVIAQSIGEGKEKQVLIDTENPINRTFLKERELIKARKAYESKEKTASSTDNKPNPESKPNIQSSNSYWELTKKAEMEIKQARAEAAKMENERLKGSLVKVDQVKSLVGNFIAEYKANFINQTELLIRDLCNENGISNEVSTRTCSKLIDITNESTKNTVQTLKLIITKLSESENQQNQ